MSLWKQTCGGRNRRTPLTSTRYGRLRKKKIMIMVLICPFSTRYTMDNYTKSEHKKLKKALDTHTFI